MFAGPDDDPQKAEFGFAQDFARAVEQRRDRPRLSDLRDSGSIEQDADVVMFIHNDDKYKENEAEHDNITEILIEKHRNGPTGKVDLYFDADKTSFLPIETDDFDTAAAEDEAAAGTAPGLARLLGRHGLLIKEGGAGHERLTIRRWASV